MPEISSHSLQISFTSGGRASLALVFSLMRSRINWEVGCWAFYGGYLGFIDCVKWHIVKVGPMVPWMGILSCVKWIKCDEHMIVTIS